jgi:signal transduction histidine kinase/CheY-like chemotaxis protein
MSAQLGNGPLMWRNLPLQAKGFIVLAIPLLAVLATASAYFVSEREAQRAEAAVDHTYQVKADIAGARGVLLNADAGVRGYLLTGSEASLAPFESAIQNVPSTLGGLARLVSDNPVETSRMERITSLAEQKLDNLTHLRFSGAPWRAVSPRQQALLIASQHIMNNLDQQFIAMQVAEDRLLGLRTRTIQRIHVWILGIIVVTAVLGVCWGIFAIILFTKGISDRVKRLEEDARRLTDGLPLTALPDGDDEIARLGHTLQHSSVLLLERERELRTAKDDADRANRAKSKFLSRMSHELRTPLNAINGFSELLLERSVGDLNSEQDEYLRDIHSSGTHLLTLINEILDLAKIEAGRMELRLEETALAEIVDSAMATLKPVIERKRLDVTAALDPAVPRIRADKVRLKQILFNLLSNAVKFTPEGGQIRVDVRRADGDVELAVADSGPGITPEDQAKLFREFTQLASTSQNGHAGTGLGLALVKRLVELHGGCVWIESRVGEGARFVVRLPLETATPPSTGDGSVLVVEDDPALRKLFVRYLAEAGYHTEEAGDGQSVVDQVKATRPSVICLDIRLPGVDGWEVLRRLKEDPATTSIPVVVTTVVDDADTAFTLGAVDFLVKPISRRSLLDAVAKALPPQGAGAATVLVVDDDPRLRDSIGHMLQEAGYAVLTASDGQEGIELARRHGPGLVMLDLLMPNISGFEVVAALRADAGTRKIPILVLTAKDLTAAEWAYLNGHVQGIRIKGAAAPAALVDEVRRVLASREAART